MSRIVRKHSYLDKDDAYMPNKQHWIHDEWYISKYSGALHMSSGYGRHAGQRSGFPFGVSKKLWVATNKGDRLDSHGIGKSDQS